jgi:cytochrome c peroxidase
LNRRIWLGLLAALLLAAIAGASWLVLRPARPSFSEGDIGLIASLSLSRLSPLPADPSNRLADDPRAAALGAALFSDQRLSASGAISCASCHVPQRGFDDGALPGQGVGQTTRRTMPLIGSAYSPWFFWDGRADSQWAQALGPLEHPGEHATTRLAVARVLEQHYAGAYQPVFGPLPDLSGLPASAGPFGTAEERQAWASLTDMARKNIDTVFANAGKAIAAFERTLAPERGRFDDFADRLTSGQPGATLSDQEQRGLATFIGRGQCTQCHNGPLLSDTFFHNTGVPQPADLPLDLGRLPALAQVDVDPFNCLGLFSDARPDQCIELRFKSTDDSLLRAFKTPSLRGVAQRAPYMHAGQLPDLESVVAHYNSAPWSPVGVTELHRLSLTDAEMADLAAFLKTL